MFIHLLAGSIVYILLGHFFGIEVGRTEIFIGAICGIAPDPISYLLRRKIRFDKWAHLHRDNISHSIFLSLPLLIVASILISPQTIMAFGAMFTHPFLDLYGIGWGVKLFYPFSNKTYKLFYKGKILTVWNDEEAKVEAEKFGDNNWVTNIYFRPNLFGTIEWLSLVIVLVLILN